jgi:WD40 repeat protein
VVRSDGTGLRRIGTFPSAGSYIQLAFSPQGDALLALKYVDRHGELRFWSLPDFELIRRRHFEESDGLWPLALAPNALGYFALFARPKEAGGLGGPVMMPFSSSGDSGSAIRLPRLAALDWWNSWIGYVLRDQPRQLFAQSIADWNTPPRLVRRHRESIGFLWFHPDGEHIAALDSSGEIHIWPIEYGASEPRRVLRLAETDELGWPDGRFEQWAGGKLIAEGYRVRLWDLGAPAMARPQTWLSPGSFNESQAPQFSFDGQWLTTEHRAGRAVWPLTHPHPFVLPIPGDGNSLDLDVAFISDGSGLISTARGELRRWDLRPGGESSLLASNRRNVAPDRRLSSAARGRLAIDPQDQFVVISTTEAVVVPLSDGSVRSLGDTEGRTWPVAVDAEGRRAAASSWDGPAEAKSIRIWDLASGEVSTLGPVDSAAEGFEGRQNDFEFLPGNRLVSVGDGGLRLWDIESGISKVLAPSSIDSRLTVFDGGRLVAYVTEERELAVTDLDTGSTQILTSHGNAVSAVAADAAGSIIVSGSDDGAVRVGRISGNEPHILFGHEGQVKSVVVSPDGRRIASIAIDHTIRVWPMPDISQPPLHTLPHGELLDKLHDLTNVQVIRHGNSPTGWRVGFGPFPGWKEAPTW